MSGKLLGNKPEVAGGVDRGLQLPAGIREHLVGAGDGPQGLWLHGCLLLGCFGGWYADGPPLYGWVARTG